MALPTGPISFRDLNTEIVTSGASDIRSLGDEDVRVIANVLTGPISLANLRGRSWFFTITVSSNRSGTNIRTLANNAGWNGLQAVQFIINSGVRVGPDSINSDTGNLASLVSRGQFPRGITLVNNGTIIGQGGRGGDAEAASTRDSSGTGRTAAASPGGPGGAAVEFSDTTRIINNGLIGGGGGGGGGAAAADFDSGSTYRSSVSVAAASSGAGGAGFGTAGVARILADTGTSSTTEGENGAATINIGTVLSAVADFEGARAVATGGSGGTRGANGAAGNASAGDTRNARPGGAGGLAIRRSRFVTIVVSGQIFGGVEN